MDRFVIVIAVTALHGCASFPGGNLPEAQPLPPLSAEADARKPAISVALTYYHYETPGGYFEDQAHDKIINVFRDTGYFSDVRKVTESREEIAHLQSAVKEYGTDLHLNIEMKEKGEFNEIMARVTGLTVGLIPSYMKEEYSLDAVLSAPQLSDDRTFQLKDHVTTWVQIFLLPLAPFKTQSTAEERVQENLFRTLAVRIHRENGAVGAD